MSTSSLLSDVLDSGSLAPAAGARGRRRALAYARVSTEDQEKRGLSISAQIQAMREYADDNDIEVVEVFKETASGFQDEERRVEFWRMMDRAQNDCDIDLVLVHEFSRFSRHPWRMPQLIGDLQTHGVQVLSATEPSFDLDTESGIWMQKVTEAKNAAYSLQVAFHTRKGMRQNIRERDEETGWCYKNGGRPIWGYVTKRQARDDIRGRPRFKAIWERNEEQIKGRPVWKWAGDMLRRAAEGASLDALRDYLNDNSVPAPRGGYWSTSTLHSLLETHVVLQYAGYGVWGARKKRRQRWNDPREWEIVENAHPAIISEQEAKRVLEARRRARETHACASARMSSVRSHGSRFVVSGGLFRCTRCGANMVGHTDRGRDGYVCGAAKYRRGLGCGPRVFVEKELLEGAVWDTVQCWARDTVRARAHEFAAGVNAELRSLWQASGGEALSKARARTETIHKKISNIRQALEDGLSDVAWANERLSVLQDERAALLKAQQDAPACSEPPKVDTQAVVDGVADLERLLPHATNEEKRELARCFVEGVDLDPDAREIEVRVKLPANTVQRVEAATGFEPVNRGFADLRLIHLATPPLSRTAQSAATRASPPQSARQDAHHT